MTYISRTVEDMLWDSDLLEELEVFIRADSEQTESSLSALQFVEEEHITEETEISGEIYAEVEMSKARLNAVKRLKAVKNIEAIEDSLDLYI